MQEVSARIVHLQCQGKTAVATLFRLLNPKLLYSHRYRYAYNVAVKDTYLKVTMLKEAFELNREVIKLLKNSPETRS